MALNIPARWLHATFTVKGGFLAGISTVTAEAIGLMSNRMKFELKGEEGGNLEIYIRALHVALSSPKEHVLDDALVGWKQLQPQLMAANGKITSELKQLLIQAWEDFLVRADKKRRCCDDADLANYDFCDHFRTRHLSFLHSSVRRSVTSKRARKGRNLDQQRG